MCGYEYGGTSLESEGLAATRVPDFAGEDVTRMWATVPQNG